MRLFYCLCLIVACCVSCSRKQGVDVTLRLAGDNRAELQKVLDHYANDEQKLRAATFLIENMPGHQSYDPVKTTEFRKEYERIMFNETLSIGQKKDLLEDLSMEYGLDAFIKEDARIITSEFLIKDIDRSFEIWEKTPYCQHLNFEQFCELILPYKVADLQELDSWKTDLSNVRTLVDMLLPDDEKFTNTQFVAEVLSKDLYHANGVNHVHDYNGYTLYNKATMRNVHFGTCKPYSLSTVAIMRSKGIPACFEWTPQWGTRATGHEWHTIYNDNGAYMPSPWNLESVPGDKFFPERKIPKIFRTTYAANPFLKEYSEESKLKLPQFSRFQKDVTDLYIGTINLKVPVEKRGLEEKYVYLATFNNTEWDPIDLGVTQGSKAVFENVGLGVVYIVLGYNGCTLVPISEPFIVHATGTIEYCVADKSTVENDVRLTKKYPTGTGTAQAENYLIGGQIQVANKEDFSDADTLFVVENHQYPDLIKADTTKRYRYVRYYQGANRQHCSLAELQIFASGAPDKQLAGEIIASEAEIGQGLPALQKVFDNDWLSFYSSRHWGGWIGLDLGAPTSIESVRIVPHSNGNSVQYGDRYELKYWHNGEWVSLGEQIARERYVVYNGVPTGALLILSNNTRGSEERPFTIENKKIRWW